ncbi:cytochrome C oxidase Cbb3 [Flavobacteriaceae bacterium R38]|nr:cytochrome C oxidase Cbb3 [Flavobacteriaceae bacterium R38]
MKFNWGTGIFIGFLAFISFIMYFVITMSTDKKYAHDLVTEEYYKQELGYQQEIDAQKNGIAPDRKIKIRRVAGGLQLEFPEILNVSEVTGKVFLYRPSNKQLDFNIPVVLSNTHLLIPDKRLLDGRWNITVDWSYENTSYLYKEQISY